MLRLVSDENFNGDIVRGLLFRLPDLNLVRVQDVGLEQAIDPVVLAWVAQDERIYRDSRPRDSASFRL
jgi:hypothetical protein